MTIADSHYRVNHWATVAAADRNSWL